MSKLSLTQAINAGLRKAMEDDPKVVLLGKTLAPWVESSVSLTD